MTGRKIVFSVFALVFSMAGMAQDMELTMQQADTLFNSRNLELLAQRCDIDIADARIAQARLYSNPVVSLDENVYNRLSGRYFDFGNKSEQVVGIDQLISIAGQHSAPLHLARLGREAAVLQFEDFLRTLRGELHNTFVALYFSQSNLGLFRSEILSLGNVLQALVTQEKKGNISPIETSRIRAFLLSLRQEQDEYAAKENELQGKLRILLSLPSDARIKAVFDADCLSGLSASGSPDMKKLEDFIQERSDVKLAAKEIDIANAQVRVEKSKAYPELHVRGQYDRNGGYFPNYFSVGFTASVPLFNRNQGAVRAAKAGVTQSTYDYSTAVSTARNELFTAYDNLNRTLSLAETVSNDFDKSNIDKLFAGVTDNYRKRNISLLEFVDFYNTYKNSMLQMSSIKENAFNAIEKLNTVAGHDVISY